VAGVGWGAGIGGGSSSLVLSAVTGIVGISLGALLGEEAVSGEEGMSRITNCSGSGDPGPSISGEAGVSGTGEVLPRGGVAD